MVDDIVVLSTGDDNPVPFGRDTGLSRCRFGQRTRGEAHTITISVTTLEVATVEAVLMDGTFNNLYC